MRVDTMSLRLILREKNTKGKMRTSDYVVLRLPNYTFNILTIFVENIKQSVKHTEEVVQEKCERKLLHRLEIY